MLTATYSPEDDKLRLYSLMRLDKDTYDLVRNAGFKYAPKQELFVAMWSIQREDFLLTLVDKITDEDTSLVDRAEAKHERLSILSDKKKDEAISARATVKSIADGIPFGQPILIGHHSEKHARKDAEKIQRNMDKAVSCWNQAGYWKDRAAGAKQHARYKMRNDVRFRRIKKIESAKRKVEKDTAQMQFVLRFYQGELKTKSGASINPLDKDRATSFLNVHDSYSILLENGERDFSPSYLLDQDKITVEEIQRQRLHRMPILLAYQERTMAHLLLRLEYETAMLEEAGGLITDKILPEKGGACRSWVCSHKGVWRYIQKVNKVSITLLDNWGNGGRNFKRLIPFDKIQDMMSKEQVDAIRDSEGMLQEDALGFTLLDTTAPAEAPVKEDMQEAFEQLEAAAKQGVSTLTCKNLFPTPTEVAERMVRLLDIDAGHSVLEPSAGTGNLLRALPNLRPDGYVTAVEIQPQLCAVLNPLADEIINTDFLEWEPGTLFDRILMNPPFDHGIDIKHIKKALTLLADDGILVALCADGPKQREAFECSCSAYIPLPEKSFQQQGTNVNVAIAVFDKR